MAKDPCEDLVEARNDALDKMWATPILTEERAEYEKLANAYAAELTACRAASDTAWTDPGYKPEDLWTLALSKRKTDISMLTAAGPGGMMVDTAIAIARGFQPAEMFEPFEYRITIKGAIAAMKHVGDYEDVNLDSLQAPMVQVDPTKDEELVAAAGYPGKSLKTVWKKMKSKVHKQGLDEVAWGYRGIFGVKAGEPYAAVESASAVIVSFVPIVGWALGSAISARLGISQTLAANIQAEFTQAIENGLALAQATAEAEAAEEATKAAKRASKETAKAERQARRQAQQAARKAAGEPEFPLGSAAIAAGGVLVLLLALRQSTR